MTSDMRYRQKVIFTLAMIATISFLLLIHSRTPVLSNIRNRCLSEFVFQQEQECKQFLVAPTTIMNRYKGMCSLFWQESSIEAEQVTVTAEQLHYKKGQLYSHSLSQTMSTVPVFDSYLTLFNNDAATVTIELPVSTYLVELHGKHDDPGPVQLFLQANNLPLGTLHFGRSDNTWGSQCLWLHPIYWSVNSIHDSTLTINAHFINDGGLNGNRDASIAYVSFRPVHIHTAHN